MIVGSALGTDVCNCTFHFLILFIYLLRVSCLKPFKVIKSLKGFDKYLYDQTTRGNAGRTDFFGFAFIFLAGDIPGTLSFQCWIEGAGIESATHGTIISI